MKLVAKMLEALDKEWFSKYVCHLLKTFTNEMNIELKMFCTSMKYRIVGKGDRTLVITPHYWRMWWRKMELLK